MEAQTQIVIQEKEGKNNHILREEHFHVLAVDDSVIERKMLEKLLTISSCHVTCVESGDKALEYLGLMNCPVINETNHNVNDHHHHHHHHHVDGDDSDEHDDGDDTTMIFPQSLPLVDAHNQQEGQGARVNLIMTDYSMPGMTGYDLLKKVKESSWKDVPVVVMSSENVPSRIHMCLEEGAEEFFLKPVRLSDLKKLQPHILKSTAPNSSAKKNTSTTATTTTDNNNIFATNDNNIKNSKEEDTTTINCDQNEDYIKISKEVMKEKDEYLLKNEIIAKISKLEQL